MQHAEAFLTLGKGDLGTFVHSYQFLSVMKMQMVKLSLLEEKIRDALKSQVSCEAH